MNNVPFALGAWQPSPLLTTWPRVPVPRWIPCECFSWSSLLAWNMQFPAEGPLLLVITPGELLECHQRTLALCTLEPNFVLNSLFLSISLNSLLYLVIWTAKTVQNTSWGGGWQMFAPCFLGWYEAISHASASGVSWWLPWHLPVCHSLIVSQGKL